MKILAIESSCDETAAAVVEDGVSILSNVVVSQIDIFAAYGGVIPEVAARSHLEAILPVVHKALTDAQVAKEEIDAIAVTHTPGLMGSLMVGTLTARMLAILWQKPLYAVHHLKSHIYSNWLNNPISLASSASADALFARRMSSPADPEGDLSSRAITSLGSATAPSSHAKCASVRCSGLPRTSSEKSKSGLLRIGSDEAKSCSRLNTPVFPLLAMVISGGHTQIIRMKAHNDFEIIGTTRDDAVGECFDKVAKILGLPYPGGPSIAKMAETGDKTKYKLPHPKVNGLDFSFSGLKTAVLRAVQHELALPISTPSYELKNGLSEQNKADFAASFQETACQILVEKLKEALKLYPDTKSVVFAGGVSANQALREVAKNSFRVPVFFPDPKLSGDNGAMVGAAAYFEVKSGVKPTDPYKLSIAPRTDIE